MNVKTISLTSNGLQNLNNFSDSGDDFIFYYASDLSFKLKINYAEFISPKISRSRSHDQSLNSIHFDYNSNDLRPYFTQDMIFFIQSLSSGHPIHIDQNQSFKLLIISILLENIELFDSINNSFQIPIDESNLDNYLEHLPLFYQISQHSQQYFNYYHIIDYIASHFYSIDKSKIYPLPKLIIYSIISNDNLKLENEDTLLDFIIEIFKTNHGEQDNQSLKINDFLGKVNFLRLTEKGLAKIFDIIDHNQINQEIWSKIVQCSHYLKDSVLQQDSTRYLLKKQIFTPDGNNANSLNGIIRHLTGIAGGNVHDNGMIVASSSGIHANLPGKFACDLDAQNYFHSTELEKSWLMYDFKDKRVHPTHYTIKSRHDYDANGSNPRDWIVEGSNTGNDGDWKKLDERIGDPSFRIRNTSQIFEIREELEPNESFRYLRITQNGHSTDNRNWFVVSALEYFGDLYSP